MAAPLRRDAGDGPVTTRCESPGPMTSASTRSRRASLRAGRPRRGRSPTSDVAGLRRLDRRSAARQPSEGCRGGLDRCGQRGLSPSRPEREGGDARSGDAIDGQRSAERSEPQGKAIVSSSTAACSSASGASAAATSNLAFGRPPRLADLAARRDASAIRTASASTPTTRLCGSAAARARTARPSRVRRWRPGRAYPLVELGDQPTSTSSDAATDDLYACQDHLADTTNAQVVRQDGRYEHPRAPRHRPRSPRSGRRSPAAQVPSASEAAPETVAQVCEVQTGLIELHDGLATRPRSITEAATAGTEANTTVLTLGGQRQRRSSPRHSPRSTTSRRIKSPRRSSS